MAKHTQNENKALRGLGIRILCGVVLGKLSLSFLVGIGKGGFSRMVVELYIVSDLRPGVEVRGKSPQENVLLHEELRYNLVQPIKQIYG